MNNIIQYKRIKGDFYMEKNFENITTEELKNYAKQNDMSEDNCLNCIFFDKNNRWCDITDPKEYQEDYELEATWCNCYERANE